MDNIEYDNRFDNLKIVIEKFLAMGFYGVPGFIHNQSEFDLNGRRHLQVTVTPRVYVQSRFLEMYYMDRDGFIWRDFHGFHVNITQAVEALAVKFDVIPEGATLSFSWQNAGEGYAT